MKKSLYKEIEVPEGIEVKFEDNILNVKGSEGELNKKFKTGKLDFEIKGNKIVIGDKKATKMEKKMMNTIAAHIQNMIKGVSEKFEYKLKICFSHFPMNVEIKSNEVIIKNFLGEKIPRKMKLPAGVDVKIEGQIITVTSLDRELAGQAAANFETATRIRKRDPRVFQDGIYITSKAGKEI